LMRFVPQAVRDWQADGTRIRFAIFVRVRARAGKRRPRTPIDPDQGRRA
jgi:hypothetical protein